MDDLERQYSPSRWSKRYPYDQVVSIHGEIMKKCTQLARENLPHKTFKYHDGDETLLEIFYKEAESIKIDGDSLDNLDFCGYPVFVYIHGGYWQWGSVFWSSFMAESFVPNDIVVVALGYDIAPKCSINDIVKQVEIGIATILKIASKSKSVISICGHSAGAHLAAMIFNVDFQLKYGIADDNLLRNFILISGIFDLTPLINTTVNDPLKMDVQTAQQNSPAFFEKFSLSKLARSEMRVLIVYGENDSDAFKQQSYEFYKALLNNHKIDKVVSKEIEAVDHFDIIENLQDADYILSKEIIQMIFSSNWSAK